MRIILLFSAITIAITGCETLTPLSHNVPIWRSWMFEGPPPGRDYPPLYSKGWIDGCESGAASSATHLYKFRYKFRQNWQLVSDTTYRRGWDDAWKYCTTYILKHNWDSIGIRII